VWDKIEGRAVFIRVLSFHPRFRRFLSCSHMWSVSFSEVVFGLGQEERNSRTFSPELCVCLNLSQKLNNSTHTMRGREWEKKNYMSMGVIIGSAKQEQYGKPEKRVVTQG